MSKPSYTPTAWVDNTAPALSAANLNHLEAGVQAVTEYAASSVQSVTAGSNVTVDNTDPANPVISASVTGGGGGTVDSVGASDSTITVDNSDPANPKVKVTAGTFDAAGAAAAAQSAAEAASVPTSRTVNGHALSGNVTVSAADVGAVPTTTTVNGHALSANVTVSATDVGAVPTSTTVNGHALSADVTLAASDVSAVATSAVGAASGVASLDSGSLLLLAEAPAGSTITVESTTSWPARPTSRTDVYVRWVDVGALGTQPSGALNGDSLLAAS